MSTINTVEIRFCPKCDGRMYVVIAQPVYWAHVATDVARCPA